MLMSVESFDASQLKKAETVEKFLLPSDEGSIVCRLSFTFDASPPTNFHCKYFSAN